MNLESAEYRELEKGEYQRMRESMEQAYEITRLRKLPPFPSEPFSTDRLVGCQ
jgi:hypothetical protein